MAAAGSSIPWDLLVSNLELVLARPGSGIATNLYARFRPDQGRELNEFVKAFAKVAEDAVLSARTRLPERYEPPNPEDTILSDDLVLRIGPTVHRYCLDLCNSPQEQVPRHRVDQIYNRALCRHADGPPCRCAISHGDRKASALLVPHQRFEANEESLYAMEIVKTLLLYGEMNTLLRLCAYPSVDYLDRWSMNDLNYSPVDLGWSRVCTLALRSFLCLNVLRRFFGVQAPSDPQSGSRMGDYRLTRSYQMMVRECCKPGGWAEVATFPHRDFFGAADGQFRYHLEAQYVVVDDFVTMVDPDPEPTRECPYGLLAVDEFLAFESTRPYLPSPSDVAFVRRALGLKGLPPELVLYVADLADYSRPRRRLEVPDDPLHEANRDELDAYLRYCWSLLVRCDVMARALGDSIPWERMVARCVDDLWGASLRHGVVYPEGKEKVICWPGRYHEGTGIRSKESTDISFL